MLAPQAQTEPSGLMAYDVEGPMPMATAPVMFRTCTGAFWSSVVPSPNWPEEFTPQAHSLPSAASARLWNRWAAMRVMPDRAVIWTGGAPEFDTVTPLPSRPELFAPCAHTAPSAIR